jgi:hypothetical protein
MKKEINNCRIQTLISPHDFQKLVALAKERKLSQAAIYREAVRWYIANNDKLKGDMRDTELSKNIKSMTDRICGMLARQGAQTGTLYELAWQNHAENKMQERFVAAANLVKSKMRKRLEDDERAIAERMGKVVEK